MKSYFNTLIITSVALAGSLTAARVCAQTVLAGWDVSGLTASGPSPWAPTTSSPNVTVGGLTKGSGITNTATANVWGANSWTNAGMADSKTQAIDGNKFVTFTITPNAGYTVSVTNISKFFVSKSATGPASGELQYSTDGTTFTDITPLAYGTQGTAISAANIGTFDLSGVAPLQNLSSNTTVTFRIVNWGASTFAGTWYLGNGNASGSDFEVSGTVISSGVPPNITGIAPTSVTTNAGGTVRFTVTATGDPASNFWYKITGATTNLIAGATSATLTLPNLLAADTADYFVVLSNAFGTATSDIVSLTVTGDPHIAAQPANTFGLLNGTVQFAVLAIGTAPGYQWYFADSSGNLVAPVSDGTQASGSTVSGANASTLTLANLQAIDPTNFVAVVTNIYSSATSTVAMLLAVTNQATLVFWDFNGPEFTNTAANPNSINNPTPYIGSGTALAVGSCLNPPTSPFSGSVDPNDGLGFTSHLPPFSWGTQSYPATGANKQNGVQFNVSTLGAKNIIVSYESRVSATASDYERLQYTTNGTTWTDYPSSSTFGGVATTYLPFRYDLSGFPGVANNPDFGIRVVTEFQSTATYGLSANASYLGTANTYGTGGTVTYDLVSISGDAITNNNTPPTISSFADTNTPDYLSLTLNFTVSDDSTAPDSLQYSAASLNPSKVSPAFTFGGSGPNRTLTIIPNTIPDPIDVAPILVTVTDSDGDSSVAWFLLTVTSVNLSPTNSLMAVKATNMLANTSLTIPFAVGDDRTPVSGLTYSVASANNTVIPSGNIVVSNTGTTNPSVTITPALNQVGVGVISVIVNDNDTQEPRSTAATIALMVRPNTNVVAIDYFNYDNSGSLDTVSGGFWQHLTGVFGQLKVGSGVATVDTLDNTENLQTPLLGAPYRTNSEAVLYSSFIVNMDPTKMPQANGTYFALFNDGSGVTGPYECRVVAATNDAAPGYYRLGINNFGADATTSQMFPLDLAPDSNVVVVTALVLSNGVSTLWVNPTDTSSPSVTDTTPFGANLFNISDFELRESGANGGSVRLSGLKVGTTLDAVFPSLSIQAAGTNVIVTWSDPTLGIQAGTNVIGPYVDLPLAVSPYTNNASTNSEMFFRFKR